MEKHVLAPQELYPAFQRVSDLHDMDVLLNKVMSCQSHCHVRGHDGR
jgi:hypothetical protein